MKVVQGRFIHTAIAAAVETDVAFLNELTEPSSVLPHPFKFANTAASIGKPVWSVFDGSAESVRALRLALKLSVLENVELMLLLAAATPAQLPGLRRKAKRIAGESGVMVRFTLLTEGEFNNLPGLIQTQGCSLLVLARDNALFAATSVRFLDNIICPVVLMN